MCDDLARHLEIFANPAPDRDYTIRIEIPEFTCLCPKTGQPDFATLILAYIPADCCIELKSLKRYIHAFRDIGTFHEAVTNRIRDDLVAILAPRYLRLTGRFNVRGGLYTTIVSDYRRADWQPQPRPE